MKIYENELPNRSKLRGIPHEGIKEIGNYLKCATYNRFTLAGALLTGLSLPAYFLLKKEGFDGLATFSLGDGLFFGQMSLFFTSYGLETYNTYKRTKEHIKKFGNLEERFSKKFSTYCDKRGVRLAAREEDLLDKLKK